MIEEWHAPYLRFKGIYEVSRTGRVRNAKTLRVLKPMRTGAKKYKSGQRSKVRFSTKPRIDFDVADLVLTTFLEPRPEGMLALHKSPDTTDNSIDNLYWGTQKTNARDMALQGRGSLQKLKPQQVQDIITRRTNGESGVSLAKEYNISQQRVCDLYKGRTSLGETNET